MQPENLVAMLVAMLEAVLMRMVMEAERRVGRM